MEDLWEQGRQELDEIRKRHPSACTACSALLAEALTADDFRERDHALNIFGALKCKRGLRQLERLAASLEKRIEPPTEHWSPPTPERYLLGSIFQAMGHMDTPGSHEILARVLRTSKDPQLRGDALDGMAFERTCFDLRLVLPFLSMNAHEAEISSALTTLMFQGYERKRPADTRKWIKPLLTHPDKMVRACAVNSLSRETSNRALILTLKNDPDPMVREMVAEGLNTIAFLEEP